MSYSLVHLGCVFLLGSGLGLATVFSANAQNSPPVMFDGLAGDLAMQNLLYANTTGRLAKGGAASATTAYTPTPALRQATVKSFVARHQRSDPATAQAVAQLSQQPGFDYGKGYRRATASYDLFDNDASDSLTAFYLLGYRIVTDAPAPTRGAAHALRAQLFRVLAHNAQVQAPHGAAQLGETMKLETLMLDSRWDVARKTNALPALRASTAALFKASYGIDFSQLQLTEQGLVKK